MLEHKTPESNKSEPRYYGPCVRPCDRGGTRPRAPGTRAPGAGEFARYGSLWPVNPPGVLQRLRDSYHAARKPRTTLFVSLNYGVPTHWRWHSGHDAQGCNACKRPFSKTYSGCFTHASDPALSSCLSSCWAFILLVGRAAKV